MDQDTTPADGRQREPEFDHVPISRRRVDSLRPSPENDQLYRPVDTADPDFQALVNSVEEFGVREPLTVTRDGWIISGHRRYAAAKEASLEFVPVIVEPIRKDADHDEFLRLLREYNRQRIKTREELLREEIVSADPEEAYAALIAHREEKASIATDGSIDIRGKKTRATISKAKTPFLLAVTAIIGKRKRFWPLSDRAIHYGLLNDPPLIHASKSDSVYANDMASYRALVDLLTRARIAGLIPMEVIADDTRSATIWDTHPNVQSFVRAELDEFLKGYWRDLLQSQENHIEIVFEKLTVASIIKPLAAKYTIPCYPSRGYSSLPPRWELAERYRKSGKNRLILIAVSDFDPDGEEIAHSLARSLRDDFGIKKIDAFKAALTAEQVERFKLPPKIRAKKTSSNYKRFVDKHGHDAFELEALEPDVVQRVLTETIDQVLDIDAFYSELDEERSDAAYLAGVREYVHRQLWDMPDNLGDEEAP